MRIVNQNSLQFDVVEEGVRIKSEKKLYAHIEDVLNQDIPGDSTRQVTKILEKESQERGFAIGGGVAVANLKLAGISKKHIGFMRLKKPVSLENCPDDDAIDLVAYVVSPQHHGPLHLRRLSRVTRLLRDRDLLSQLRNVENEDGLRAVLQFARPETRKKAA